MFAYLDPGSGSMIVQALVAGAAGVAVVGKVGWKRLKSPFSKGAAGDEPAETPTAETEPTSAEQ